ncbi:hypothetical protein CU254_12645 [Amycolatopsis sp. AA4]|uniref:hypothetical protein n=1 Tax=Actinomycetes TaxID=1760 RepID=UPI0001B56015|nr:MULTISPECIES: hypothetical protein [Actinomycetes]ATY11222.1 hypothetical protein CU254_12645 [Amycolatopsis sp. AA4]
MVAGHFAPVTLWAAVWRTRARGALPGLELSLRLRDVPAGVSVGADPGESLEAVTVENAGSVLALADRTSMRYGVMPRPGGIFLVDGLMS